MQLFSPSLTNTQEALVQAYVESKCSTLLFGDHLPEQGSTFSLLLPRVPGRSTHVLPSADAFLMGTLPGIPDDDYGSPVDWLSQEHTVSGIFQSAGTTGTSTLHGARQVPLMK